MGSPDPLGKCRGSGRGSKRLSPQRETSRGAGCGPSQTKVLRGAGAGSLGRWWSSRRRDGRIGVRAGCAPGIGPTGYQEEQERESNDGHHHHAPQGKGRARRTARFLMRMQGTGWGRETPRGIAYPQVPCAKVRPSERGVGFAEGSPATKGVWADGGGGAPTGGIRMALPLAAPGFIPSIAGSAGRSAHTRGGHLHRRVVRTCLPGNGAGAGMQAAGCPASGDRLSNLRRVEVAAIEKGRNGRLPRDLFRGPACVSRKTVWYSSYPGH